MSYIVNRPDEEPGFRMERTDTRGRSMSYNIRSYAADKPSGSRYG